MRILVITAHDAVNLSIENVVREFIRRGHEVGIFARRMENRHIRMFKNLNIPIMPMSELTVQKIKKYDCAFCPMDSVSSLTFQDIYIFTYNFIFNNRWTTAGGDFMFVQTENRPILQWEDCARMAVGSPKNDAVIEQKVNNNKILFVDTGHYPFGMEGKAQLSETLLSFCRKFPDYDFIVKPRWLPNEINDIHVSTIHLYDVIADLCDGRLPDNLQLLYEYRDMQDLIDECIAVITPGSSAYLDAALRGKGILILDGFKSENSYDLRTDTIWKQQFADMAESGCLVHYKDAEKYLPYGIKCSEDHLNKVTAYRGNVSYEIANVMEYVVRKFLSKNRFPAIQRYDLLSYQEKIQEDSNINYTALKQRRMKNQVLAISRRFDWVAADIDYSRWLDLLDCCYRDYLPNPESLRAFSGKMHRELQELWAEHKEELSRDPIDQSLFLQSLFNTGRHEEILNLKPNEVVCQCAYNYYMGRICKEQRQYTEAIQYLKKFLDEVSGRSYLKYPQDNYRIVAGAYCLQIDMYFELLDYENFGKTYAEFRGKGLEHYTNKTVLERIYKRLPDAAKKMIEVGEHKIAAACLSYYVGDEKKYKVNADAATIKKLRRELAQVKHNKTYLLVRGITWLPRKIRGGIRCYCENGFEYTVRRIKEHIQNNRIFRKIRACSVWKIWDIFRKKVLFGFSTYSDIFRIYGCDTFIQVAASSNGDLYLEFKYYKDYVSKLYSSKKNVVVTNAEGLVDIGNWYGIERLKEISTKEWEAIIKLYVFTPGIPINILHLHIFLRHTGILAYLEGLHGLTFMDMQKEGLFSGMHSCKPALIDCIQEITDLFIKNKLQQGKTVVLSPYANSVKKIPMQYWILLSKALHVRGFSVCTNAFGQQVPICDTCKVSLPFQKMEQFISMAGYFVSNRSGIDDITHNAVCKRVEVYAKNNYKRSLVADLAGCYAYSNNYIIVSNDDIDTSVAETLKLLGITEEE